VWEAVEHFATEHQHTISALEAFSTFSAVVVSLALAIMSVRASRTKLKASLAVNVIIHDSINPDERPEVLAVSITNVGTIALHVPFAFFSWKVPLRRGYMTVNPMDFYAGDTWIPQKKYPVEVAPKITVFFYLSDHETFRDVMFTEFQRLGFLHRQAARLVHAIVLTADGRKFKVKVSKQLRRELREFCRKILPQDP
jgi:hypothetical protein